MWKVVCWQFICKDHLLQRLFCYFVGRIQFRLAVHYCTFNSSNFASNPWYIGLRSSGLEMWTAVDVQGLSLWMWYDPLNEGWWFHAQKVIYCSLYISSLKHMIWNKTPDDISTIRYLVNTYICRGNLEVSILSNQYIVWVCIIHKLFHCFPDH